MKPSQIVSMVITLLLIALGVVMTRNVLPLAMIPICTAIIGIGGSVSGNLLPAFVPTKLPAHVIQVIGQVLTPVTAALGAMAPVVSLIPNMPSWVTPWLGCGIAVLSAITHAVIPHTQAATKTDNADVTPTATPAVSSTNA